MFQVCGYLLPASAAAELNDAFPEVMRRLQELWTLRAAQAANLVLQTPPFWMPDSDRIIAFVD